MVAPLVSRRPKRPMPAIAFVAVLAPLLALAWCWATRRELTSADPRVALLAHVLVLLVPVVWTYFVFSERNVYLANDERELARRSAVADGWWCLTGPLATLVLAMIFLGSAAVHAFAQGAVPERSGPAEVILWWTLLTPFLLFWNAVLREPAIVRVGEEGVRVGNLRFVEWARLVGYARRGSHFELFHEASLHVPLSQIRLARESDAAFFAEQLRVHRVAEISTPFAFTVVRVCAFLFGGALAASGYAASSYGIPRVWVLVTVFAGGIATMAALDFHRGIRRVTAIRPVMEAPDQTDAR